METIGVDAFDDCKNLNIIHVKDCCEVSLSCTGIPTSAMVVLPRETTVSGRLLVELRRLREVIIPENTEKIGNSWFWGSGIEKVVIPNNVWKIGLETFCNCRYLKDLTFKKIRAKRSSATDIAGSGAP